jgi:hypothetical protein
VFDVLDDLGADGKPLPKAASGLEALHWFATASLTDSIGALDLKRVLLLDDLQFLSDEQSTWLKQALTNARAGCGIWIAERLEALPAEDLIAEGALEGRDYDGEIRLEARWRKRSVAFTKFVDQIADLRVREADGFEGRSFLPPLQTIFIRSVGTASLETPVGALSSDWRCASGASSAIRNG